MFTQNNRFSGKRHVARCAAPLLSVFLVFGLQQSLQASFIASDSASMSDLLAGESLLANGAEFSDWQLNNNLDVGGAIEIDPATVTIQAGTNGDQVGLWFLLGSAVGPGQIVDLDLTYKVSSEVPLSAAFALMDGAAANGTGVVSMSETLFESFPGIPVGAMSVSTLNAQNLADQTTFDPALAMVVVRKDIVLTGGAAGTASLSSFFQLYEQVPEPASGISIMIALVGLGWMRRR